MSEYREELPEGCPPLAACEAEEGTSVYRFVAGDVVTDDDFKSQRALKPDRDFGDMPECIARGLSVLANQKAAENAKLLSSLKRKHICRVTIGQGAGPLMPTGQREGHRTWWPLAKFPVLSHCEVLP